MLIWAGFYSYFVASGIFNCFVLEGFCGLVGFGVLRCGLFDLGLLCLIRLRLVILVLRVVCVLYLYLV